MENQNTYPIKVVSNLTDLSIHVIRAWEKRYNVVIPKRTETNRRLYSQSDIEKLSLLSDATAQGYPIGSISNYTTEKLKSILIAEKVKETNTTNNTRQLASRVFKIVLIFDNKFS